MIVGVLVRRLHEGRDWADFKQAWYPEVGFGVPTRVLAGVRLDDPREIVTVGFSDIATEDVARLLADPRIAAESERRHAEIDRVIESFPLQAIYEVVDDQDFTGTPTPWPADSLGAGIIVPGR